MVLKDEKMATVPVRKLILSMGIPMIISMVLQAVYNIVDSAFVSNMEIGGEDALNALTLAFPLQVLMVAITPITAFSYGMRNNKRIKDCLKFGQLYTGIIMLAGTAILEIFANPFAGLFNLSGETLNFCIDAIRIVSISLVFAGINIAFQGVFQAVGSGIGSLAVSVGRQLLFVFPFAVWFAAIAKSNIQMSSLMWWVFPIAEILTAVVAVILWRKISAKKIRAI